MLTASMYFFLLCCMYDNRIIYLIHDVSNSSNHDYSMCNWYYGMTNTVRPWAAQFLIGSKNTWDTWIHLMKIFELHNFLMILFSHYYMTQVAQNLSYMDFFWSQKTCISRPYCIYISILHDHMTYLENKE